MAIVEEDLERLRASLVLSDVVQQHLALRRVGRNWVGLCPFHAERSGSFNVRDETGRYRCFGCGAAGDVFKFVQEIEHVDFVTAVESLASKAGIQLTYTTGESGDRTRQKRRQLVDAMAKAVEWYHDRLLNGPDARAARDYLRKRGLAGDTARTFKIGWAPDEWDALCRDLGVPADVLRETGLGFTNKAGRMQDSFRGRVLFPILTENGDPVAFGGRILPGSTDPAKYKNSSETAIYAKSKTLYGLNWAKGDIVAADQVIVCEGYTDVIGFHRAGVKRAVATCGTALTEDHVRLLKRYASNVVLAFDADAAGQGAAQRFYEWEERYQVRVSVARFPDGKDPGELSVSDPEGLRHAVDQALPFLGFRVNRVLNSRKLRSPEDRALVAGEAMAVVNEHQNPEVRKLYAGQVATHVGIPPADLVALAARRVKAPTVHIAPVRRIGAAENAEFVCIAMLLQRWDDIAPWLMEELFAEEVARRAFLAVAESGGAIEPALDRADPEAREFLERAAVADVDADPVLEARNLIAAATRRRLAQMVVDIAPDQLPAIRGARLQLDEMEDPERADVAAEALLGWLHGASEGAE
ncbi:MAG: DNA primase [Ilumatobacteraceae bacterium]|jgi:DNA primase|nr:DNA primase [Acidimicrobiaceae bacterium]MBP6489097.1 DNA primase [Ilumatobacteraceae bacterium]MBP7890022.1 DNA primase [Ilumatobacteraceae bacterium]MBP8211195.1 DNA primase [Ilumatobacteraceae bacterium]MBP9053567.1 DNA primase [Ilumatobacteraceae bacterium]